MFNFSCLRVHSRLNILVLTFSKYKYSVWLLFASVLLSTQSFAAPVTFFGENQSPGGTVSGDPVTARTAFLAALSGGVGTEDFEGFADGTIAPINLIFPGTTGNITATLTGSGDIENSPNSGRFATSGSNYYETNANFQISFSSPIAAFGFFATDIGDFSGQMSLVLTNGGTVPIVIPHTVNGNNGSLLYFGFVDTANTYTAINFSTSTGNDFFGFDDMTIGDAQQVVVVPPVVPVNPQNIPVFGPLGLLASLLGLLWFGRRRQS